MSQLVFQDLLLGSGARWIEDVFGEGLLPRRGNGVEGGEQKEEDQGVARNQEASDRDEPPSSCRQSQLEAAVGVTTTHVRRVNLTGGVYQDHHDHSQKRCDVAPQFALVHTRHVP